MHLIARFSVFVEVLTMIGGVDDSGVTQVRFREKSPEKLSDAPGNTVFIGNRGATKFRNNMIGHMLNLDTARNALNNFMEYIQHLEKMGVEKYVVSFPNARIIPLAKKAQELLYETKNRGYIGKSKNSNVYIFVVIFNSPEA